MSKVDLGVALLELVVKLNLEEPVRTELVGIAVLDIADVTAAPLPLRKVLWLLAFSWVLGVRVVRYIQG